MCVEKNEYDKETLAPLYSAQTFRQRKYIVKKKNHVATKAR